MTISQAEDSDSNLQMDVIDKEPEKNDEVNNKTSTENVL